MPVKVTAWKCEFCNMTSVYKGNVTRHEKTTCPKNDSCQLCANYSEEFETVYNPFHGGDPGPTDYEVPGMFCDDDEIHEKQSNCPRFVASEVKKE